MLVLDEQDRAVTLDCPERPLPADDAAMADHTQYGYPRSRHGVRRELSHKGTSPKSRAKGVSPT